MIASSPHPTRLMLVGELTEATRLAAEMVRGSAMRIGVGAASQATLEGWTGPGTDVVVVDLSVNLKDVLSRLRGVGGEGASVTASISGLVGQNIADVERELILQTLHHCAGNRSAAATMLGISVRTMRNKLRSFSAEGMDVPPSSASASRPHAGAVT